MKTHFINLKIDLRANTDLLRQQIEVELEKMGQPLRWAITKIDSQTHTALIEAIVTTPD